MSSPQIDSSAKIMQGALVQGDVRIGAKSSVWYNTVIRGDVGNVLVGERTNIQDACVLHTRCGEMLSVGSGVTVGHGCILHGCTIEGNTVIGMGSIVMDGAIVGENCIVGAGSLVTGGTHIPSGVLAFGRPAKVVRPLSDEEIRSNTTTALSYIRAATEQANTL